MKDIVKFLTTVLYYVEKKNYPLAVAFKRAYLHNKPRKIESNLLYEYSKRMLLSYYALPQSKRSFKVRYWLENKESIEIKFPNWMEEKLSTLLDINALKRKLSERWMWARVNILKTGIDKIYRELESQNIEFEVDKNFYYMIKIKKSPVRLSSLSIVKDCKLVIHDKASSLVVEALKPEIGEKLVDLSSAPGIKASLYMMLTENRAETFLADVDFKRLSREYNLLKRCGVDLRKIHIIYQDSTKNSVIKSDKILLDAPCSSSGMINNDPSILLKLSDNEKIKKFAKLQKSLLNESLKIRANKLVYAVCSLFPEEGERVIEDYYDIAEMPFSNYQSGYSLYKVGKRSNRTFPHIDSTEGFFISVLNLTKL
ncbi:Fmu (Sun) domain protein [Sulfolobus islandicus Y.G.57.14]|uniref:Fmu (Sun) domain protein n=2 Tax=Saccharolobus islandicus TaxID=43080 RepID=C3N892_SACI7|nr:RsmB/NOP family class I SAM-dependent RNA methyltransferase [Sulfolobus islandicus]ACP46379.1 Fmu (Sun) domain protein [Sulfolobus islandicus Y.G.57.14]ACP47915.1 Fmu (Sun) domain protein [Sulfolobus islandicus Y.N.15.51]PVU77170.1 RsmB/NOP family class I SAM-dependent RNA methyltransferase [Sulfolobus islandicus]